MRFSLYAALLVFIGSGTAHADLKTENVILVMTDGLRWQEVFAGADEALMNKEHGNVGNLGALKAKFWRDKPEERRALLMPFFWNVIAKDGQVIGNQTKGSIAQVTNGLNFSYPGYSETLCGYADPAVDSNRKIPNPNVTVFEWLNKKPEYQGNVAAFGAWDVFPSIFNRGRCGFLINAGYETFEDGTLTPTMHLLNRMKELTIKYWEGEPFDSLTFETAMEYLRTREPRVFFLSLGETDEWAHEGAYDHYLESAHNADEMVKRVWDAVQSMPKYKDKTTLIFSPDHGRGDAPEGWKSHGKDTAGSENIWMGFLGPDTPAKGEWSGGDSVTQSQIAATVAAFLGEDYAKTVPQAAKPIGAVLGR
jgi:hypothetical protein